MNSSTTGVAIASLITAVASVVAALQASFATRQGLKRELARDIEQALSRELLQIAGQGDIDAKKQERSERNIALAHASPEIKYLIVQGEKERDMLRDELKALHEATKPQPVRQFFGNFFWNAGSLAAGVVVGHFIHW